MPLPNIIGCLFQNLQVKLRLQPKGSVNIMQTTTTIHLLQEPDAGLRMRKGDRLTGRSLIDLQPRSSLGAPTGIAVLDEVVALVSGTTIRARPIDGFRVATS